MNGSGMLRWRAVHLFISSVCRETRIRSPRPRHRAGRELIFERFRPGRDLPMFAFARAGLAAALVVFACLAAGAADKPFQRSDLADAALKLEAEIKSDAGQPGKPA